MKKKFVCPVCGFIYEHESMTEDFKCPVCKTPGNKFMKVVDTTLKPIK